MVSTSQATGTCRARSFCFCWCGSSFLDVHFKLSILTWKQKKENREKRGKGEETVRGGDALILPHVLTFSGLAVVVLDVVVGFVLLVLSQDILAGHSRDDRQVSWWRLGQGGIALVQQELAVIDDPGSCGRKTQDTLSLFVYIPGNVIQLKCLDFTQALQMESFLTQHHTLYRMLL